MHDLQLGLDDVLSFLKPDTFIGAGIYLLVFVLGYVLCIGLLIVVVIAMMLVPGAGSPQRQQSLGVIMVFVYYGATFAVQALTKPVYAIALLLFYYDQRIRLEGFDIEWMMQQAGMVVPALPDGAAPDAVSGTSVPAVTEQAQVATPVRDSDIESPRARCAASWAVMNRTRSGCLFFSTGRRKIIPTLPKRRAAPLDRVKWPPGSQKTVTSRRPAGARAARRPGASIGSRSSLASRRRHRGRATALIIR